MKKAWITTEQWQACAFHVDLIKLERKPCYLGMELSALQDITAAALCFPPQSSRERYQFLFRFFIPSEIIMEREGKEKIPFSSWINKGLVTATPGNVTDYDFIEQQILEDAERYEIRGIAYDSWKAPEIVNHLMNKGFTMIQINQTFSGMARPTEIFKKKVLTRVIAHDGNPIMNWMISCTELKRNKQGEEIPKNLLYEKSYKKGTPIRDWPENKSRIKGVVASIMALGIAVGPTEK